jgi:pre-rRNA-processing protein TSR3
MLLPSDSEMARNHGLVVIDCSWNLADGVFRQRFKGEQRKLPILLAGNPTNYSKQSRLSSLEAVAGALYIMGVKEHAKKLLSLYKWGETFLTLNFDLLEDYSNAKDIAEIENVEKQYFAHSQTR